MKKSINRRILSWSLMLMLLLLPVTMFSQNNIVITGKITDSNDRLIFNGEEKRFLDKPAEDQVYRFI